MSRFLKLCQEHDRRLARQRAARRRWAYEDKQRGVTHYKRRRQPDPFQELGLTLIKLAVAFGLIAVVCGF